MVLFCDFAGVSLIGNFTQAKGEIIQTNWKKLITLVWFYVTLIAWGRQQQENFYQA